MDNHFYRGKRIRENEWAYGNLEECLNEYNETFYRIKKPIKLDYAFSAMVVNTKTVSKCIDYTGDFKTSIFEGDIISYECDYDSLDGFSKTAYCQAVAVYNEREKQFGFIFNVEGVPEFCNWGDIVADYDYSIVGNIWDNPELVKVRLDEYFNEDEEV